MDFVKFIRSVCGSLSTATGCLQDLVPHPGAIYSLRAGFERNNEARSIIKKGGNFCSNSGLVPILFFQ